MAHIEELFVTRVYRARLAGARLRHLNGALDSSCRAIAAQDKAGQRWAREHGYKGYTSYASLNDLAWRDPSFAELGAALDRHVAAFARAVEFDLRGRRLVRDSLWINILEPGGRHAGHIHPHAAISGTYYVAVPKGASAIRFEDPRHPQMMAAPARKPTAKRGNRTFVEIAPDPGTVLLWEGFLRHDVPENKARRDRISISFNYRLD